VHPIDLAQFWPGYDVVASRPVAENTLLIELEPQATRVPRCGRCLEPCPLIHERRLRHVRDRDLLDQRVLLQFNYSIARASRRLPALLWAGDRTDPLAGWSRLPA
jgi:hypothetical protein